MGPGALLLAGVHDDHGAALPEDVLAIVAKRFEGLVRPDDVVHRLDAERFSVFLRGADVYVATIVASRMLDALDAPVHLGPAQIRVRVAIGVDASPDRSSDEQLAAAAAALERARTTGRVEVAR